MTSLFIDSRYIYYPKKLAEAGFGYCAIGG